MMYGNRAFGVIVGSTSNFNVFQSFDLKSGDVENLHGVDSDGVPIPGKPPGGPRMNESEIPGSNYYFAERELPLGKKFWRDRGAFDKAYSEAKRNWADSSDFDEHIHYVDDEEVHRAWEILSGDDRDEEFEEYNSIDYESFHPSSRFSTVGETFETQLVVSSSMDTRHVSFSSPPSGDISLDEKHSPQQHTLESALAEIERLNSLANRTSYVPERSYMTPIVLSELNSGPSEFMTHGHSITSPGPSDGKKCLGRLYTKTDEQLFRKVKVNSHFERFCLLNQISFLDKYLLPQMTSSTLKSVLDRTSDSVTVTPHSEAFRMASSYFEKIIFPHVSGCRVWDVQETCDSLDPASSPMWPFSRGGLNTSLAIKKFSKEINAHWDESCTPGYKRRIWGVFNKDEPTSKEKLSNNRVRGIVGSPIDSRVTISRLSLDLNKRLMGSRSSHPIQLGCGHWYAGIDTTLQVMSDRFKGSGPVLFRESDVPAWDLQFTYFFRGFLADFRFRSLHPRYQTSENRTRFLNMYSECFWTPVLLADGRLFWFHAAMNSGDPNTATDNSMGNVLLQYYNHFWVLMHYPSVEKHFSLHSPPEMFRSFIVVGDDEIEQCTELYSRLVTPEMLSEAYSSAGMLVPPSRISTGPLSERTWLGGVLRLIGDTWVPTGNFQKMLCNLRYCRKSSGLDRTIQRALGIRAALLWNDKFSVVDNYVNYLLKLGADPTKVRVPRKTSDVDLDICLSYKTRLELTRMSLGHT